MTPCDFCTYPCVPTDFTTGYAVHDSGKIACFSCCAWLDVIAMMRGEPIALYSNGGDSVGNWPATLHLMITQKSTSRHNMAGSVTHMRFVGPEGRIWRGTEYHGPSSGNLLRNVRRLAV